MIHKGKDMDQATYPVVCGKVTDWALEKNGITYYGGARFTLTWEDGLIEEGVPAPQLVKVYSNTPQSLGGCTVLDEELMQELLRIGQAAGPVLGRYAHTNLSNHLTHDTI